MSAFPYSDDVLDASVQLFQLVDVAKQLGQPVTRVHQLLRDHHLLAVKRDGYIGVPAAFFGADGNTLKQIPGLIAVMRDGGYSDSEILRWMFAEDDSLPGKPAEALHSTPRARCCAGRRRWRSELGDARRPPTSAQVPIRSTAGVRTAQINPSSLARRTASRRFAAGNLVRIADTW